MEEASNILWIVDLNRQSLDRIIPGIRVRCWREMFAANGWSIVDAKYGRKLEAAFQEPNGELLRISYRRNVQYGLSATAPCFATVHSSRVAAKYQPLSQMTWHA